MCNKFCNVVNVFTQILYTDSAFSFYTSAVGVVSLTPPTTFCLSVWVTTAAIGQQEIGGKNSDPPFSVQATKLRRRQRLKAFFSYAERETA